MPTVIRTILDRYLPFAILAGASLLAGCEPTNKADQAAASGQLHQAASDLTAAASETVDAVKTEAQAAKPALKRLARDTDRSAAKLAAATSDAANDAGAAFNQAAQNVQH